MIVWRDGDLMDAGSGRPGVDDRGYLLGDGLFETLRVEARRPRRAKAHLARLSRSAEALGLALSAPPIETIAESLCRANGLENAILRLTVSRQGGRGLDGGDRVSVLGSVSPFDPAAASGPVRLALSRLRRSPDSVTTRHKTLSYADSIAARREARGKGADMALLCDTDGHLSGADAANIVWVRDGRLHTPAEACAVLPGTARAALLAALDIAAGAYEPAALEGAEAVFVTNALVGARPVAALDGRELKTSDDWARRLTRILFD